MITDYLKAGFPTILLQTQEPHRADELMRKIPEWQICRWDCVSGVHGMAMSSFTLNEIQNPVEAVQWLSTVKDTVLIAHGLQHFLDDPVVCQSILFAGRASATVWSWSPHYRLFRFNSNRSFISSR